MKRKNEVAVLGGGCFWCTEAIFNRLKGVISVTPGYAGGITNNPTYDQVGSGQTKHAEVIKIEYDPAIISFTQLLDIFFSVHDPTSLNRQGNDVGTQYRSIILYMTEEQKNQAEKIIKELQKTSQKQIVTEVKPLEKFYPAEDYHQNYFALNSEQPYCQLVISPKLAHFRQKYASLLK